MRERPILFSAPMVRALLVGRKTQTRRMVKWPWWADDDATRVQLVPHPHKVWLTTVDADAWLPPCAEVGDRLWVRETWAPLDDANRTAAPIGARALYRADRPFVVEPSRWRPSIHMPRWASRLTLEVTGVRVERLQAITEEDAVAEGVERAPGRDVPAAMGGGVETWRDYRDDDAWCTSACASFASLWQSLNGAGSWAANPWVWVVAFRVMTP